MSFPGLYTQPRATCPMAGPRDVAESSKLGIPDLVPLFSILSCFMILAKSLPLSGPWPQTGFWGAIGFLEGVAGLPLEVGVQASWARPQTQPQPGQLCFCLLIYTRIM